MNAPYKCAFCGKLQSDVRTLIAGPECMICDRCVMTCVDVLVDRQHAERNQPLTLPAVLASAATDSPTPSAAPGRPVA